MHPVCLFWRYAVFLDKKIPKRPRIFLKQTRPILGLRLVDHASNPLLESDTAEVENESRLEPEHARVGQALCLEHRLHDWRGLQFYGHRRINKHVELLVLAMRLQLDALVGDGNLHLTPDLVSCLPQLPRESSFVNLLFQSRSNDTVDLNCIPNDVLGKFVLRCLEFHVVPSDAHYTKPDRGIWGILTRSKTILQAEKLIKFAKHLTIASCLLPRPLLLDARGSESRIGEIAPSCD